ncbi:MAG: glutamate 5-kinase [Proteobacteria bacterium]|nr:MAG: glutamate 5-kinase [Pseudomonadota bacterium]
MNNRDKYTRKSQRWIVKIGSALLTQDGKGLDYQAIADWAGQMAELRRQGVEMVLVSSGSIAEGMSRMGWVSRPTALPELQAAAAIGQTGLIQAYQTEFQKYGIQAAQILLTHDDVSHRLRYLNARNTLRTLTRLGTLPIVNENDTVAFEEIRLGDNDTLGAVVASLVEADLMVILTDQQGLYDKDPRHHGDAELIREGVAMDPEFVQFAGSAGTAIGSGGMATKVQAARRAAKSGCATVIVSGREKQVLSRLRQGESLGTLLVPEDTKLVARKQWIAGQTQAHGTLFLDAGAVAALCSSGKSLLPVGVERCSGQFKRGDRVDCADAEGRIVARGLCNYSSSDVAKICKTPSHNIQDILGYMGEKELIHRDNLVLED